MKQSPKIKIVPLAQTNSDYEYWISQPREKRIAALEEIRTEYNSWRYGARQEFQRVYRITKLQ